MSPKFFRPLLFSSCWVANMANCRLLSVSIIYICHGQISMCTNGVAESTVKWITGDATTHFHLANCVACFDMHLKHYY